MTTNGIIPTLSSPSNGYENSPACIMLASRCACCGKELVDSDSVETGVGPVCRKKHGYAVPCAPADAEQVAVKMDVLLEQKVLAPNGKGPQALVKGDWRGVSNALVHAAALVQGTDKVHELASVVHACGYHKLAARISDNAGAIKVSASWHPVLGNCLLVKTPYNEAFNNALRSYGVKARWVGAGQKVMSGPRKGQKLAKGRYVALSSRKELWSAFQSAFAGSAVVGSKGIKEIPALDAA